MMRHDATTGECIRYVRMSLDLSRRELAKVSKEVLGGNGISEGTITKIETGEREREGMLSTLEGIMMSLKAIGANDSLKTLHKDLKRDAQELLNSGSEPGLIESLKRMRRHDENEPEEKLSMGYILPLELRLVMRKDNRELVVRMKEKYGISSKMLAKMAGIAFEPVHNFIRGDDIELASLSKMWVALLKYHREVGEPVGGRAKRIKDTIDEIESGGRTIGKAFKAARVVSGLTKTELARVAGVSKNTVLSLEGGKRYTKEGTMRRIINALNPEGRETLVRYMPDEWLWLLEG